VPHELNRGFPLFIKNVFLSILVCPLFCNIRQDFSDKLSEIDLMQKQIRDLSIEDLSKKSGVIPKRLIVACDLCARHSRQDAEYEKRENNPMKSSAFSLLVLLTAVPVVSMVGCTSLTGQTAGQYVDDRTITSTVKPS
jgi:hypothetical protein